MVLTERRKTTGVRAKFTFSPDEQRLSNVEVDKSNSFPGRSLKAKEEEVLGLSGDFQEQVLSITYICIYIYLIS